ncbi:NAD-dependent epimerase/dehydratase family protein [Acuticoccus kandeliae]|uniref:NAD-dependent epimerase/dehydratase family protein n=1 Tax=Acuticoccus kandeliae TaxID=2073160 RepID=UPI000D3E7838|nr:NAD(P)-dependent oxidoreductase [Acuticoccus kandeliae]
MRVFFTGGSGKAGRHVIPYLIDQGHDVLNVDLTPLDHPGVNNLIADVTDSGAVFGAMTSHLNIDDVRGATGPAHFDAVVHFAAVPRIQIKPDNETFRINTISTYNVIETAVKLGIKKIIFASSETTYGVCFAQGVRKPEYIPVDEAHPTLPEDSYAMSKVVNELTGQSFQKRSGLDIYALRINNVIEPHEYETLFPDFMKNPEQRRVNFFSYIDARDLGQIVDLCMKKDGLGYQVFNASNDTHSVNETTADLIAQYYADVPKKADMGTHETFFSNKKIRDVLGFKENHDWRKYLKA